MNAYIHVWTHDDCPNAGSLYFYLRSSIQVTFPVGTNNAHHWLICVYLCICLFLWSNISPLGSYAEDVGNLKKFQNPSNFNWLKDSNLSKTSPEPAPFIVWHVGIANILSSSSGRYSNVGWLFCTPAPPKIYEKACCGFFFQLRELI